MGCRTDQASVFLRRARQFLVAAACRTRWEDLSWLFRRPGIHRSLTPRTLRRSDLFQEAAPPADAVVLPFQRACPASRRARLHAARSFCRAALLRAAHRWRL